MLQGKDDVSEVLLGDVRIRNTVVVLQAASQQEVAFDCCFRPLRQSSEARDFLGIRQAAVTRDIKDALIYERCDVGRDGVR